MNDDDLRDLRARVLSLEADLDAHRRATALMIDDLERKLVTAQRQQRARQDAHDYYCIESRVA